MHKIHCSNPTCAASVPLACTPQSLYFDWHLNNVNWALQQQPGDVKPMPYCPRCKE